MKKMLCLLGWTSAICLVGCGAQELPNRGFVYDDESSMHAADVQRLIELEAEEFHRPQWVHELSQLEIEVTSFYPLVPCGETSALGCTVFFGKEVPIVLRTLRAEHLENTAIPHELIHIYAATVLGDIDADHTHFPSVWDAGERAFHRYEAEVGGPRAEESATLGAK